jgi:hypothetical protein
MEDGRSRLSSTTLARVLSIAGHPFVLAPLTVAAGTRSLRWAAVLAAGTFLPLLVILLRNVRRGTWSDVDVSRHDQRSGLYYAAAPLLLVSAVLLYFLDASPGLLRALAAVAVMLGVGLLANRFLKVSMHMMTAAFCCVLLARLYPASVFAAVPFVFAIAWSRWKLERHTIAEIVFGTALGAAAALFV